MNPQERQVIDGIFERLKNVASQPRDAETERYIADLVRQQPYAPYALAQSVYVQEQALLNQQQQIEQLQAELAQARQAAPASGGFLGGLFGGGARNVPAPQAGPWGGQPTAPAAGPWGQAQAAAQPRQGMGFLGTAAAAAAGVAGGMVLGNILGNAFGGGQAHAATPPQQPAQDFFGQPAQEEPASYDDGGDWGGGDSYDA